MIDHYFPSERVRQRIRSTGYSEIGCQTEIAKQIVNAGVGVGQAPA